MNRRLNTFESPSQNRIPSSAEVQDYQLKVEAGGHTFELPFKPKTPVEVGTIALKEVIRFDTPGVSESRQEPQRGEGSHFAEMPERAGIPEGESPAEADIDADTAKKLHGFRRESLEGRHGPAYDNTVDTTYEQQIDRWQDWVRGTGRMLDEAWDAGAITDENLQEWIAFKGQVEKFHGITDFYELADIGKLRGEVFQFVQRLGVADKAYAAYDAATE